MPSYGGSFMVTYDSHPKITLDMEKGIYVFPPESATGKTYLFGILRNLQMTGCPIVTYNYWDYTMGVKLGDKLREFNPEVVMVDRMDCFDTDEDVRSSLLSMRSKAIVLLDLKYLSPPPFGCRFAEIDLSPDAIEVVG